MATSDVVEAIGEAINSLLSLLQTSKEAQSESEIIKTKRKLEKAVDISEQILKIVAPYIDSFSSADIRKIKRLLNRFIRYN